MSRSKLNMASGVVVLLLVVFVWWATGGDSRENGASSTGSASNPSFEAPPATRLPVTAEQARRGQLVMRITATGTAEANRLLKVTSEVAGKILAVAVRESEMVGAGQLLVGLDDTELKLSRDQAEEALVNRVMSYLNAQLTLGEGESGSPGSGSGGSESARDFLRRMISPQGYRTIQAQPHLEERLETMTREDLLSAQAQLTDRRVALEKSELDLRRSKITAPFAGRLTGLDTPVGPNAQTWPVVGQRVADGTELMMLVDSDPIRLRVEVIESEIGLIQEGRRAEVHFAAYPGQTFYGTIEAISPIVDSQRKSLSVSVRLPNPAGRLKPGMFAQVVLDTEVFEDTLLVPAPAVLLRDDRWMLFVVRNGLAQWEYVQKGLENPDWVEILDGVSEGEVVITSGHFTLAHDTPVDIVNEPEGLTEGGGQLP